MIRYPRIHVRLARNNLREPTPTPPIPLSLVDIQVTLGDYLTFGNHIFGSFIIENKGTDEETVPVTISDSRDWTKERVHTLAPGKSKKVYFVYRITGTEQATITATAVIDADITPDNNVATTTVSLNTRSFFRVGRDGDSDYHSSR